MMYDFFLRDLTRASVTHVIASSQDGSVRFHFGTFFWGLFYSIYSRFIRENRVKYLPHY